MTASTACPGFLVVSARAEETRHAANNHEQHPEHELYQHECQGHDAADQLNDETHAVRMVVERPCRHRVHSRGSMAGRAEEGPTRLTKANGRPISSVSRNDHGRLTSVRRLRDLREQSAKIRVRPAS